MRLSYSLALAISLSVAPVLGCDGDKAKDGLRSQCAVGGGLTQCEPSAASIIDACNKLVDCAAIPVDHDEENGFDWGRCVDFLSSRQPDQQSFILSCVASAVCDELQTDGSPNNPYGEIPCLQFGERP